MSCSNERMAGFGELCGHQDPSFLSKGAECKVEAARMVRITLPKKVYPELNTRNSFTINALRQPGSNGTLFAKESSLS